MNPFPKYRKVRVKKDSSEATQEVMDRIVESNPWHQWWKGIFPGLLFIICVVGVLLIAVIVGRLGLEPLSFFIGSISTAIVIAIFQRLRK